jgi:hypothetical protein
MSARLGLADALRGDASDASTLEKVEAHYAAAAAAAPEPCKRAADRALLADARGRLALLLCQQGRDAEAAALMRQLGARYRLARCVLRYPLPPPATRPATPPAVVNALDGALLPSMLAHLRAAFAPEGAFWGAHAYHSPATGYFSFVHPLGAQPATAFDQARAPAHACSPAAR